MNYSIIILFLTVFSFNSFSNKRLFKKKCLSCHSFQAEEGKYSLVDVVNSKDKEWMKTFLLDATNKHKTFTFKDRKFKKLLNYVYAKAGGTDEQINNYEGNIASGKTLSKACLNCHGTNGEANDPKTPNLKGQNLEYLVGQLLAYKEKSRIDPKLNMNDVVKNLSRRDIINLATFYTSKK